MRRDSGAAPPGAALSRWADIAGAEHVAAGGPAVDGVEPAWTVRPGSIEEVSAIVAEGPALVASGLGGHLDLGAPPSALDVLLRLDRLDAIVAHEAADMTVTVQAGCPLTRLQETLGAAGQWLPLDPPRPDVTSIGGLLAANLSGPLRASQGTARDLLLGIRVVGAGGTPIASGGRVVKNVAGYDLSKLHVGALGTAGVVVEATLKVRPRPEREAAVTVLCATAAEAAELALAVRDAFDPLWIEVAGPGVLADRAVLAVGAGGLAAEVNAARETVVALARSHGWEAAADDEGADLRRRLGGLCAQPGEIVLRAATLPGEVGALMERLQREAEGAGTSVRTVAHAANGVVRAAVEHPAAVAPLVAALRPALEAAGGALVVERAATALKRDVDVWGDPGPGRALMARLRQTYDPAGIFSPGRFVV